MDAKKRCKEAQLYLYIGTVARWWEIQNFLVSQKLDRRLLPLLGLPHSDRHQPRRSLSSKESLRKDHRDATSRYKSSVRTDEKEGWLRSYDKSFGGPSGRTRKNKYSYSKERANHATKHTGPKDSTILGMAQLTSEDTHFSTTTTSSSSSSSWSRNWWEGTHWWDTYWRDRWYDHQWQHHQWVNWFFRFSVTEKAIPLQATVSVQTTPRRTHIFLTLTSLSPSVIRLAQGPSGSRNWDVFHVCFVEKNLIRTSCHCGTRIPIRATPVLGGQSGSMADTTQNKGYEKQFWVDVSSEHTPIHFPSRSNSFNREDDLTNTTAASEDFDHFVRPGAARGSKHSAASTVTALLNFGSLFGTRKLVRNKEFVRSSFSGARKLVESNESVAGVEEAMLRGKRSRV